MAVEDDDDDDDEEKKRWMSNVNEDEWNELVGNVLRFSILICCCCCLRLEGDLD